MQHHLLASFQRATEKVILIEEAGKIVGSMQIEESARFHFRALIEEAEETGERVRGESGAYEFLYF